MKVRRGANLEDSYMRKPAALDLVTGAQSASHGSYIMAAAWDRNRTGSGLQ
jgi:hypothetical protein